MKNERKGLIYLLSAVAVSIPGIVYMERNDLKIRETSPPPIVQEYNELEENINQISEAIRWAPGVESLLADERIQYVAKKDSLENTQPYRVASQDYDNSLKDIRNKNKKVAIPMLLVVGGLAVKGLRISKKRDS